MTLESDGIINFISQFSRFFDLLTSDDFDLPQLNSPQLDFGQKQRAQLGKTNKPCARMLSPQLNQVIGVDTRERG